MIKMQVVNATDEHGASIYKLSPSGIRVGNENAHNVDTLHFDLPEEWLGMTVRATFIPNKSGETSKALIVDSDGNIEVSSAITESNGIMVVDAWNENSHAYTTNVRYVIVNHSEVGGEEPAYTPTQIEQIIAQAQVLRNDTVSAKNVALDASETAIRESTNARLSASTALKAKEDTQAIADKAKTDVLNSVNTGVEKIERTAEEVDREFRTSARNKFVEFDNNAEEKTQEFNQFSANKIYEFERFTQNKTADFDTNATEKTNEINTIISTAETTVSGYASQAKAYRDRAELYKDISVNYGNRANDYAEKAEQSATEANDNRIETGRIYNETVRYVDGIEEEFEEIKDAVVVTYEYAEEAMKIAAQVYQAEGYPNYRALIEHLNNLMGTTFYTTNQIFNIATPDVPDLYVYDIKDDYKSYIYTTDQAIVDIIDDGGIIQVGYYGLGKLETTKVDLTDYVKNTDYATAGKGGVIKRYMTTAFLLDGNGYPFARELSYDVFGNLNGRAFISKSTLENVINNQLVRFGQAQELTTAQKTQARDNIGAMQNFQELTESQYDALVDKSGYYFIVED